MTSTLNFSDRDSIKAQADLISIMVLLGLQVKQGEKEREKKEL